MKYITLSALFLHVFVWPAIAQDKANEIMVSDKACTERKLAACIMESSFDIKGLSPQISCPEGATEISRGPSPGGIGITVTCKVTNPRTIFKKPSFTEEYNRCKVLVDSFPSQYGENCLKSRTDERQLATMSSILSQIEKHLCDRADGTKCDDLNKIPE